MLGDLRQRVQDLRAAADRLEDVLTGPAATRLPGLAVAQAFTATDAAATRLSKLTAVLVVAASQADQRPPDVLPGPDAKAQ